MSKYDSRLVYSGIYRDGAKISVRLFPEDYQVELVIRRDFDSDEESYIMRPEQAMEMSYGLLRAYKQATDKQFDDKENPSEEN